MSSRVSCPNPGLSALIKYGKDRGVPAKPLREEGEVTESLAGWLPEKALTGAMRHKPGSKGVTPTSQGYQCQPGVRRSRTRGRTAGPQGSRENTIQVSVVAAIAPEVNVSGMARNRKNPPHTPKKPAGPRESYCVPVLEVPQPPQHRLGGRRLARRAGKKG